MNIRTIAIAGALALTPLTSMAFGNYLFEWFPQASENVMIKTGGVSGYIVDGYNIPRDIFVVGSTPIVIEKEEVIVKRY